MVEMTGVEPAWTCSQNKWVTVTLHLDFMIFLKVVKNVVKPIFDRFFHQAKAPWICMVREVVRKIASQSFLQGLCSQKPRPTNWSTPRFFIFSQSGQKCGQTDFWPHFSWGKSAVNLYGWRGYAENGSARSYAKSMLPNFARYQLRHTPK